MKNFDKIGEDLFNKIRGRFPNVTIGDEEGNVTNEPEQARFFDFDYRSGERKLGKVSVSISEDNGLTVIFSRDFIKNEDELTQKEWYNFLRELRKFSKKRLLNFDVRDITKTNLTKRDYKFLAANRPGDETMNESKLYGTGRVSYQNVDDARLVIKHSENIDQENPAARTRNINSIYIESAEGERFKYPYRHLSGARAMARHVAEGGKPYDDFGSHITELSEEMWKLRKFKNYVGRSSVMAESLEGYMDIVKERVTTIKKTIESLQKPNRYHEAVDSFEKPIFEEVPEDVKENWIDELTIRQFNEELKDVFPYIYNLVKEGSRAKALGPEDLLGEETVDKDLSENDRYRSNKNYQLINKDYNGFAVYATIEPSVQGRHLGVAVSNASGKEPEGIKSLGGSAQAAGDVVMQKIDNKTADAKKVTSDATLDFNAAFGNQFFQGDFEDLGVEKLQDIFAKVIPGPKLVIANMYYYEKQGVSPAKDGFSKASDRDSSKTGGSKMIGVRLSSKRVQAAELVANGRYIVGDPQTDRKTGNYVYPMNFESVVNDKSEKVRFKKPAVTVGSSRVEEIEDLVSEDDDPCWKNYKQVGMKKKGGKKVPNCVPKEEIELEQGFEEMMGQFSEATTGHGSLYVKFRAKNSLERNEKNNPIQNLTGFADFAQDPEQVKEKTALRKFYRLVSMKDIANAIKKMTKDKTFISAKKIILFRDSPGLEKKFPQLEEFYNWIESSYSGDKISIEEPEDDLDKPEGEKGIRKKQLPKGHAASGEKDVTAPEKKMTRYFTIDNDRLLTFLRKQMPDFMNKHYKANMGMFMMGQGDYQQFRKFLQSPKIIDNYGTTSINVDKERSFAENNEEKEQKTPISEFILSYFDYTTGQFPKGETAVLTMIEKDYGEEFIEPAKAFIERINERVSEVMGYKEPDIQEISNRGDDRLTKEYNYPDDMDQSYLDGDDSIEDAFDEAKQEILYNIKNYDEEILRDLANPNYYDPEQVDDEISDLSSEVVDSFVRGRYDDNVADEISSDLYSYAKQLLYKKFQSVSKQENREELEMQKDDSEYNRIRELAGLK